MENFIFCAVKGNKIGAIFTDLSDEAFDTLIQFLLIAKLDAYSFDSLNCFCIWNNYISVPA